MNSRSSGRRGDAVEEEALRALALLALAGWDYATLSSGERQRVHIARARSSLSSRR